MSTDAAAAEWKVLSDGVAWKRPPLFCFRQSFETLQERLGPPPLRDLDSNGTGLFDCWPLRFPCGLELVLWAFQVEPDFSPVPPFAPRWIEVHATDNDFAHVVAHSPVPMPDVSPWLPDRREYPPRSWRLLRQDDNGQVFEIEVFSTECEARMQAARLERLGHKQLYWVERRG